MEHFAKKIASVVEKEKYLYQHLLYSLPNDGLWTTFSAESIGRVSMLKIKIRGKNTLTRLTDSGWSMDKNTGNLSQQSQMHSGPHNLDIYTKSKRTQDASYPLPDRCTPWYGVYFEGIYDRLLFEGGV